MGIIEWLDSALADARYGLRTIAANRTFSLLAILSLALGIGANTAIYSFMDSLLLRSLPVSDPESLAVLNWGANLTGRDSVVRGMAGSTWSEDKWLTAAGIFPFPAFELIRANSGAVFSGVFAYRPTRNVNVMVKGVPAVVLDGALSVKCVAVAALTVKLFEVPVMLDVFVSVAVMVSLPVASSVAENVPTPLVRVMLPGSVKEPSVVLKCTVPV